MTRAEAFRAVEVGLDLADRWAGGGGVPGRRPGRDGDRQHDHRLDPARRPDRRRARPVVGRGTGVDDEGLGRKVAVVERGPGHSTPSRPPTPGTSWPGSAASRSSAWPAWRSARPGIGPWSSSTASSARVAGLVAATALPGSRPARFVAAHLGPEPGHRVVLDALGLDPLLELGLRLGEGTGAALALPLIASAADILRDMATFESAAVSGPVASPRAVMTLVLVTPPHKMGRPGCIS